MDIIILDSALDMVLSRCKMLCCLWQIFDSIFIRYQKISAC